VECTVYALRLLSRRGFFEEELAARLKEKYTDSEAEKTLDELKELNYIDDSRLLENFVLWQFEKGHGELYIREALKRKGVDCPIDKIRAILILAENDRLSSVRKCAEKYFRRHAESSKAVQGCFRYLAARGFLTDDILKVLNDIKKERT
jgi:SOS response regulatory protein OraA/RecX